MYRKIALILFPLFLLFSCSSGKGTIEFTANGEENLVKGLTSKDGWHLKFNKVLVNLANITAYNPKDKSLIAKLDGIHPVELIKKQGFGTIVPVGTLNDVKAGNYQSLRFSLKQSNSGDLAGASILISGEAEKDGNTIPFTIRLDDELTYDGIDGYVGNTVKGLLKKGGSTKVEMTFHFDHLFGDASAPADDHVNTGSPGFAIFLAYEKHGVIDVTQDNMKNNSLYPLLINAIDSLGHLGEGHCEVIR